MCQIAVITVSTPLLGYCVFFYPCVLFNDDACRCADESMSLKYSLLVSAQNGYFIVSIATVKDYNNLILFIGR